MRRLRPGTPTTLASLIGLALPCATGCMLSLGVGDLPAAGPPSCGDGVAATYSMTPERASRPRYQELARDVLLEAGLAPHESEQAQLGTPHFAFSLAFENRPEDPNPAEMDAHFIASAATGMIVPYWVVERAAMTLVHVAEDGTTTTIEARNDQLHALWAPFIAWGLPRALANPIVGTPEERFHRNLLRHAVERACDIDGDDRGASEAAVARSGRERVVITVESARLSREGPA